jgi:hypothetical protein
MVPIHYSDIPLDRRKDVSYYNPQVKEKPSDPGFITRRTRGTIGGDRIEYHDRTAANTASLETFKLLIHSTVSDPLAHWATLDINDFYLGTPLDRNEYIKIALRFIPPNTIKRYTLDPFINTGYIYFRLDRTLWGLAQAGYLSQQRLIKHLKSFGFHEYKNTPMLFHHVTRNIIFSLVVDDFGIKYHHRPDVEYLMTCLAPIYTYKIDWTGSRYLGFTIKFSVSPTGARSVSLSMPEYIPKALQRFRPLGLKPASTPAIYTPPSYGRHGPPLDTTTDTSPLLDSSFITEIQAITGVLLYYARAVDSLILPAVHSISQSQSKPTLLTQKKIDRLLQYLSSHPNHSLVYHACNMQLHIQSDASHHSLPNSRSIAGNVIYCGNSDPTLINGPILCDTSIIPVVTASAAESEYGAAFRAASNAVPLRLTLEDLGWPQPPTTLLTDNLCATGVANNTIKRKRSKAFSTRFHWLRDRVQQGEFSIIFRKGCHNLADYFTKPLPLKRHNQLAQFLVVPY